jgi:hypothetical protein
MSSCEINDDAEKLHMCSILPSIFAHKSAPRRRFASPLANTVRRSTCAMQNGRTRAAAIVIIVHVLPWLAHRSGSTDALPPEPGRTVPTSEQFLLGTTLAMTIDKRRGSSERRYDIA